METKEIVLLKKLEVNPRGSGLRNYWAGAIFEAFKTIEKTFQVLGNRNFLLISKQTQNNKQ